MKRNEAMEILRGLVGKDAKAAEALQALEITRPARAKKVHPFFGHFVNVGDSLTETEIFNLYHTGRRDTYWIIADAIKLTDDKSTRKWVILEGEKYVLKGIGVTPPIGWGGYVPIKEKPKTPAK